jgi:hypothetical protein
VLNNHRFDDGWRELLHASKEPRGRSAAVKRKVSATGPAGH